MDREQLYEACDTALDQFLEVIAEESDRGSVLVAAAFIDSGLYAILKRSLVTHDKKPDPLFDHANAPLSSFSSRTHLCHRLGLISPSLARDIHRIRKIRNAFAHDPSHCSFADPTVIAALDTLFTGFPLLLSRSFDESDPNKARRDKFVFAAGWMTWWIHTRLLEIEPIPERENEFGYDNPEESFRECAKAAKDLFFKARGRPLCTDDLDDLQTILKEALINPPPPDGGTAP